ITSGARSLSAMDRLEDLLRRIRDPRECHELLLGAPRGDARSVASQLAAVLSSLPAVHRELGGEPRCPAAVAELVRRVGVLELLLLKLAGQSKESSHGTRARGVGAHRATRAGGIPGLGRVALL